jgi:hypothetical protein
MTAEEFATQYEKETSSIPHVQHLRVVIDSKRDFHAIRSFDSNLVLVFDTFGKLIFAEVK